MEALISALQSFNLDLKDPHVSSAISTLTTRLDADRALTAEQEAYLATITHAVICKTATSPGGEPRFRALHASAVAFALATLEKKVKADTFATETSAPSPLALLELLEAATIKEKAEAQSADAQAAASKYAEEQPLFGGGVTDHGTPVPAPSRDAGGPSLAFALRSAVQLESGHTQGLKAQNDTRLPLAKDLPSATLHHAILHTGLVQRILAICDALVQPLASPALPDRPRTWHAVRRRLSLTSQLMLYLEEILLLQAPVHIASEVEPWLVLIASQIGAVYKAMLESLRNPEPGADGTGEEGPSELLLVNELLGVAETARVSPTVLVNLKTLLAATLVDTTGRLEMPDLETLLEPGSAFSDAHESLPHGGEDQAGAGGSSLELGPSVVSLAVQLIQEVDQELAPSESQFDTKPENGSAADTLAGLVSSFEPKRLISLPQSEPFLGAFEWRRKQSRESLLGLILPPAGKWLDRLVAMLLVNPDQEGYGVEERSDAGEGHPEDGGAALSKNQSTKPALPAKEDNLFGDLFQEAMASRGVSEASHRELPVDLHPPAKEISHGGWAEAPIQVAQFLGGCAFDSRWCPAVLDASCSLLRKEHLVAVVTSCAWNGAGGSRVGALGAALCKLVDALTLQDGRLAGTPGLVRELAVQLYTQGARADVLLAILAKWLLRKERGPDGAATVSGEPAAKGAGKGRESEEAPREEDGASLRSLVTALWEAVFQSIGTLAVSPGSGQQSAVPADAELSPLEHALASLPTHRQVSVLLLGFHLLERADRVALLTAAMEHLETAANALKLQSASQAGNSISGDAATSRAGHQLAVSRLVLLAGSLLGHLDRYPGWLPGQLQRLLELSSSPSPGPSSNSSSLSLTASLAQQIGTASNSPLADKALVQSLFLLGQTDAPASESEEDASLKVAKGGASSEVATSFLRSLLRVLASAGPPCGSTTELLIDRYLSEVCWRNLRSWPLPALPEADSAEATALQLAWLLEVARRDPPPGTAVGLKQVELLSSAWSAVSLGSVMAGNGHESDARTIGILAVLEVGLREMKAGNGGRSEAAQRSECFGQWYESRKPGAFLRELCALLDGAADRYVARLRSYLEGCYGGEAAQVVMVLLKARLGNLATFEGALVKAGVSVTTLRSVLQGGRSLLDGLSPASPQSGAGLTDASGNGGITDGILGGDFESWWEAAVLLPGFPSTAEVSSALVASSQMLLSAILSCIEGVLSLADPGESGWSVVEEAVSRATLTGLLDSEGALVNRIWASHPSLDVDKATLRELHHSVTLCQNLLEQWVVSTPGQQAPTPAHPSPPPLGKHLDTVREALILDVADKLEALLDEPTGRGLSILSKYFSGKAGEVVDLARADSPAASEPPGGDDAVSAAREAVKGNPSFLLSALSNSPSPLLNRRILALLVKMLSPQKDGAVFGSTAGGASEPEVETGSSRASLAGSIAHRLRAGLLGMGESGLATWLQERLLGNAGGSLTWHVPAQQRESAGQLLEALVDDSRGATDDFNSQLLTALLSRLQPAYATFEAKSVDAYFDLIVRLAADHPRLIQRTLEVATDLLNAFALQAGSISAEQLGHVQKLLGFLGAVLTSAAATSAAQQQGGAPAAQEALFRPGRAGHFERRDRSVSRNRAPQVHEAIVESREEGRDEAVREDSEDEEEEDLISFGEEDEEEEGFEGDDETVDLDEDEGFESGETSSDDDDAKLCTFGASGSNFIEQHWYFCYTCDLVISKGCCSTCARVCHQGHKVVYSKFSRFFCDCGAGGSRSNPCQALRPRGPRSDTSSNLRGQSSGSAAPADRASARGRASGETASDSGSEAWFEPQGVLQSELFPKLRVDSGVLAFLEEKGLEAVLLKLCDSFAVALGLGNGGLRYIGDEPAFDFSLAGGLTQRNDIVTFARAHKYGTFETKLKMEYSSAREVKAALASGAISKSLLTVSKRGKVAIGEGDKVSVFEAAVLTATSADKGPPKPLSKNSVRFQVLNLEFNPANDAHLVVSGYEDCQVFILNSRGEVTDRLAVELALEPETFVVQASWVPGSQVELLVVTNRSVKLYDLSKDKISPAYYVTVSQESIKQAVLARDSEDLLRIIVLTQQGVLFTAKLSPQEGSQGAILLTERLQLPPERQWPGSRGCSLSYFSEHRTLISSYEDGQVVIGRLADTFTSFKKVCFLSENERSGNLHFWRAVCEASGVYVAANSARQGAAVAVQLAEGTVGTQTLRQVGGPSLLRMEGVATYAPPGPGQKSMVLVLNDDGGLQVFSHAPAEVGDRSGAPGSAYVRGRADVSDRRPPQPTALAASFPLTFFENTQCITQNVTWGGDLGDSDAIKLSLAAEESFLEAPTARPFKVMVTNSAAETVMVGCRIHVGTTGRANVPCQVQVFDRTVVLEEGVRRWYDIPFTVVESLTADRSFTLTIRPAPNNQLSRIDAIEIYARSKEDFGWREKVESMRDLLQQNRAVPSASSAPSLEAPAAAPVSPIEEGLCAGLEVLGLFYGRSATGGVSPVSKPTSSPRLTGHDHFEDAVEEQSDAVDEIAAPNLDRPINPSPGCLALLEKAVSASEPHPSVQSFAQRVLSALHPGPSELQKAKDAIFMSAFATSVGPCTRALSQGGHRARTRAAHVFTARIHWASEIASQRFEHFREAVARQGPDFSDKLVGAFEAVVAKESLEATDLSALTIDIVEVLCGCAQGALSETGDPTAAGKQPCSRDGTLASSECKDGAASGAAAGSTGTTASAPQGSQSLLGKQPEQGETQTGGGGAHRAEDILRVLRTLLFSPQEPVRSAASVALSSHLLQSKLATSAAPLQPLAETGTSQEVERPARAGHVVIDAVQFSCDGCSVCPIVRRRWHCTQCPDFDLCERCYEGRGERRFDQHRSEHAMVCLPVDDPFNFSSPIPNPRNVAEASSHPLSDSGDDSDEASEPAEPRSVQSAGNQTAEAASSSEGPRDEMAYLAIEEMSEEEHLKLALELSMQEAQPESVASVSENAEAGRSSAGLQTDAGGANPTGGAEVDNSGEAGQVAASRGSQEREKEPPAIDPQALFRRMLLESFASDVGWMHRCSGLEAVPILQLLARLASERAPGGTLGLYGFDVRRLVEAMLRELNLGNPLPVESRSDWGEVAVLTLKFFAFVLTDWEGADGELGMGAEGHKRKTRSDLPRASDGPKEALRQPGLLEYLLSVLQRLVPEFAKPKREKAGGAGHDQQGALLHSRHDKTLSSLQPFFPDAYTRAHGRGVFAEFPKLVLGAALDLAEALTESGLKIDGGALAAKDGTAPEGPWVDVLCSYIYCSQTHFVRDSARHVLLQACGGHKPAFNLARDSWLLGKELQQLQRLSDKSDAFQRPLPHDKSVKLVKCLGVLAETAEKRPRSWQWFCAPGKTPDALTFLLRVTYFLTEEAVLQALKLLALALAEEKEDGGPASARPSAEFLFGNATELERFVRFFLLDFGAKAVRAQARAVLQNAWLRADSETQRGALLASIVDTIPELSSYGTNVHEISALLKWLFAKGAERDPSGWSAALASAGVSARVLGALRTHNRLLETHPNGRAYGTLQSLIEFDGYYLESEPCTACNNVEVPFSKLKLESIKQETKYTDNRILVRCPSSYTLESFSMAVHDARRSKSVKVLRLYYNNRAASDLSELKGNWALWKKVKSYHLAPNQAELKAELTVPVTGCNFMFEFAELYENLQASSLEHLQCPRCSRHVTDRHGICPHCHENCFQCRQCRNINYENLDSFLCNECGYSKYGRFEFSVNAKPSFAFDAIESEDDMQKCLAVIEKESENAHKQYQQLLATKKPLLRLISMVGDASGDQDPAQGPHQVAAPPSSSPTLKVNQNVAVLGVLYGNKCKEAFEQVSRSVQALHGARKALTAYLERSSSGAGTTQAPVLPTAPKRPLSRCYGCASTLVTHALEWLHLLADSPGEKQKMVDQGLVQELFESGIHHGSQQVRASTRLLICTLVRDNPAASESLTALIRQRVFYCLDHPRTTELAVQAKNDCQLLREACSLNDSCWEPRLKLAFEVLFRGVEVGTDSPPIAENVILPCLRIVAQACTVPAVGSQKAPGAEGAPKPGGSVVGGLSQAFSSLGEASTAGGVDVRRSFAQVASAAARQGTRGTQSAAASRPQPARPPPTRPAPLVVAPESQSGPRLERSEKGGLTVTYKEWSNGSVGFETLAQQQRGKAALSALNPSEASKAPARLSASLRLGSLKPRPEVLTRRVVSKWRGARARRQLGALDRDSWIKGLVLSASSPAIRTEACALVRTLSASGSPARRLRFLDLMTELLTSARDARAEAVVEYFELYRDMLAEEDGRLYLAVKGWLRSACGLIVSEVHRIRAQEGNYLMANVNEGFFLQHVIGFLRSFLEVGTIRHRFVRDGLLTSLLEALLSLKSLVIQKTKLTASCAQELSGLLEMLLETGEDTQRSFVRACMGALEAHAGAKNEHRGGQRAATFIMNQLCDVIQPVRPEPVYLLTLNKAHTQEEFIRGAMAQNPYSSADVGPLMRDVKNKICTQLEMLGLIEDDYGMELLVAGSIVSLDLSIKQVYEKVWLRTQQALGVQSVADCPPMSVTYRLQGLDGEATEPMISEVDDDRGEQQDPEVEFALTGEMETCGGLELLLKILRKSPQGRGELGALLKLLGFCCKLRTNRRTLLRLDALHVLLERARAAVSVSSPEQDGTAEALLEIIESLVTEANEMAAGGLDNVTLTGPTSAGVTTPRGRSWAGEAREEEAVAAVKMFLDKLAYRPPPVQGGRNAPDSRGGKQKDVKSQADAVARILPFLTYGEPAAMECLIGHFVPFMDFQEFDRLCAADGKQEETASRAADHRQRLESFVKVCESIRLDANGDLLKSLFLERGLVSRGLHYLKDVFPPVTSAGAAALEIRSVPEFTQALLLPSVPIVLGMLTGLANGHPQIQGLMEREGVLPLLHALEGVSSEQKEIRAKAEGVLDIVSDEASGGALTASVNALRKATKDELRVRAMKRREAMLKGLGMASAMTSDGADRIVVSAKPKIEGLDEMEEEGDDSLACMVCREGYKLKPAECLGTYSFSKRVNGGGMLGVRSEFIYTTVSHFNVIHFTCHVEAKRADSKLKTPKKEWEGAALRNSETLANSIFPLRGPDVTPQNYSRYCDQYWENLAALGRADGSRFKLLAHDLAALLGRFASGGSFSVDSHGGSKESNAQLLPFMVQMGAYLLEQVGSSQRRTLRKSLQAYLGVTEASRTPGPATPLSSSRRSSFADGASTTPSSSTPELSSTPGGSSLPPRSPAPAVARSLDESVHLMLILSLLLHSLKEWQRHRREFLQRAIHFAYNQTRESRPLMPVPPSPSPGGSLTDLSSLFTAGPLAVQTPDGGFDPRAAFKAVKPIAIMVALIDKLQKFFKKGGAGSRAGEQEPRTWAAFPESVPVPAQTPDDEELSFSFSRGSPTPRTPGEASPLRRGAAEGRDSGAQRSPSRRPSSEDSGDHSWELVMKERLNDIPAMLAFAKEFQELVEDLHAAEDLMELLDTVDCLSDIYGPAGGSSWEEFLEQTVTGVTPRASFVS